MAKLKLSNGMVYPIADYATPNSFVILLDSVHASEVLETMTEENLSEIQFLTDNGEITGTYHNKMICGYTDDGCTFTININDADLCRYGLVLDEDNRIVNALVQRYAPEDAIIVSKLPNGYLHDYQYINNEYVYNPIPKEEPVEVPSQLDIIEAQVTYTAMMTNTLLEV